jgi:hypothetical protein
MMDKNINTTKETDNFSKASEDVGLENNEGKTNYLACRAVAG